MRDNFERCLDLVLNHEGGWSKHPSDPGGATMFGITKKTYESYLGRAVSDHELREIPRAHVADIYRRRYWNMVAADDLPAGVDYATFDGAVNSGPPRGAKWLQRAVRARADGVVGSETLAAVDRMVKSGETETIVYRMCADRLNFLKALKTFPVFGKGWTARVNGVLRVALSMIKSAPTEVPAPPAVRSFWPLILVALAAAAALFAELFL